MLKTYENNQTINANLRLARIKIRMALMVLFVFAMVLFALASYISQPLTAGAYLNPDINTLTYMAYNITHEHGSFSAWHISTSPSYVPEMVFFFLITFISKNPFVNLLSFVVFQITCVAILIPAIFKAATQSSAGLRLGVISVFVFLTTVVLKHPFNMYGEYAYLSTLLAPGFHYGAALLVFASIFVFLKILTNKKAYLKVLFFCLLVIAGLSDPLTYVYFTFPMAVTLSIFWFFKQLSHKDYFIYLAILVLSFITAFTLYRFTPIQYVQLSLKPSFSILLVLDFIKTIIFFIGKNWVWTIFWFLFMFWAPYSIWQSFKKKTGSIQLIDYVVLLQFITVLVSTPLIILAVNQTFPSSLQVFPTASFWTSPVKFYNELAYLPYRYLINYLLGPIFLGYPLLLYKHYQGFIEKLNKNVIYAVILAVFAVTLFMLRDHHFHKNNLLYFQSDITECIDNYAKEYHLTNGLSDSYYVTNMANSFAEGKFHIALVDSSLLTPIRWQNTEQLYQYHNYNFAISNSKRMPAALKKAYGNPLHTFTCTGNYGDKFTLYIYPDGKMNAIFNKYLAANQP